MALTAAAVLTVSFAAPASAAAPTHETGIYGGGSTLAAQVIRQLFDCYGNHVAGDGFSASASFHSSPPTPGLLPSACAHPAAGNAFFEGLYAGTGSGRGRQGFIGHDSAQLYGGSGTSTALPGTPPPYTDAGSVNTYYNSYPYPSALISFADSDSALPGSPSNPSATLSATLINTTTATYNVAKWGPAIQLPLLETPITIAANVNGLTLRQATPPSGTSKLQLSVADVCAIFSGTVTNWDSTASIPGYDVTGAVSTVHFDQDNNPNWLVSASTTKFASHSLPIKVVVRSDSSGTSFLFTNWLHKVCAPLSAGYATLFAGPQNTFASLFPGAVLPANFTAVSGSNAIATAIGNAAGASDGAVGYLTPDVTKRYSSLSYAPVTAAIQDAYQRANGVVHARANAGFIAPTPVSTDAGIKNISPPAKNATYPDWDLTNAAADPTVATAYPIAGFTFMEFYTCYAKGTALIKTGSKSDGTYNDRFNAITGFLNWYYPVTQASALVKEVVENNGFHELSQPLTAAVHAEYLTASSASRIAQAGKTAACTGSGA